MSKQSTGIKRVAIYARVSTEEQTRGYGIGVQVDGCTEFVGRKEGWAVHDVYKDEGVSGSLTSRPQLNRLMEDAKAGRIDIVVVHKYSRIGRTGRAFWRWIWRLEDLEVGFVSVTQEIVDTTTPTGMAQLQMYAMFAEMDYNTIRDQMQDGLQAKATQGGWPGGAPPYGYRIEGKGKKGSFLVQDENEVKILRRMRTMAVEDGLNTRQMAARLNAEGLVTRSGVPWSHTNLRGKLLSDSTIKAIVTFRNPKRSLAGHGVRLNKDGTAKHGETVVIKLDPVFTPEEVADLSRAMGRLANGKPKAQPQSYPLSTLLFNEFTGCGSHFIGMKRTSRDGRWYRCTGKKQKYPGDPMCSCDMVDADAMESAVWKEVVGLLGDPDRLKAMATEWLGMAAGEQTNHADRIAELDRQISEREKAITTTVTEYAKAGLPVVALEAATRAMTEELGQLQSMRAEATAWMEETEAAEQRAKDLQALATAARTRLADMDPSEQAEVLALLDVRVTITGPVPKTKVGLVCSMTDWFKANDRLVPGELTDEAWALVEPVIKAWEPPHHRLRDGRVLLNAMFYKARHGVRWADLPERFGAWTGIHTRYKTWANNGVWEQLLSALPNEGTRAPELSLVPPFRIEGRVDPRMMTADIPAEEVSPETGLPGPATSALSAGVHELLRGDAALVTDAAEVAELVGDMGELAPDRRGPVLPRDLLDPAAARVLAALPAHGTASPQDTARGAGTTADDAVARLYELRSLGFVERHGDGWKLTRQATISVDTDRGRC